MLVDKFSEKRGSPRTSLAVPAELTFRNQENDSEVSFQVETRDVSATGICCDGAVPVEVGTEMQINLQIPLEKLRAVTDRIAQVELDGVVVRISGGKMALHFR